MLSLQQIVILIGIYVLSLGIIGVCFKRFKGFALGFAGMTVMGVFYMIYALVTLRQSGWADLIVTVTTVYTFGLGVILGLISEIGFRIYFYLKRK